MRGSLASSMSPSSEEEVSPKAKGRLKEPAILTQLNQVDSTLTTRAPLGARAAFFPSKDAGKPLCPVWLPHLPTAWRSPQLPRLDTPDPDPWLACLTHC